MSDAQFRFVEVPPPKGVPSYKCSTDYGVLACLRVEPHQGGPFRCAMCGHMDDGDLIVWVPDSVIYARNNTIRDVELAARANAFNGAGSGVCLQCAQKLSGNGPIKRAIRAITAPSKAPEPETPKSKAVQYADYHASLFALFMAGAFFGAAFFWWMS